jgi:hypothetical protein
MEAAINDHSLLMYSVKSFFFMLACITLMCYKLAKIDKKEKVESLG